MGFSGTAQNLVPNPSFEDTTISCAQWLSNPYPPGNVAYWFNPTGGTPDYFNAASCGGTPNGIGFQFPYSGNAVIGIGAYIIPSMNDREYVACTLTQPLEASKKYCVSFFVSLADRSRYAIDGMGALLTADTATCVGYCLLPFTPQISNQTGNILSDTVNWMLISGGLTASGGEKIITIGNFKADSDLTIINTGQVSNVSGYYYIDNISVIEMTCDTANAGNDVTICEGDSVRLGTPSFAGCIYRWQTATGLDDTTIAQPTATPAQTTTYILLVTDTSTGTLCEWTSMDTVTVTVIPFTPQIANAGTDAILCMGESVVLGTASCNSCTYQWQPFSSLNNATSAQPTANPVQTISYILTMTDSVPPCGKTTTDNVTVFVENCGIEVYNIFTPNNDGKNETFTIKNLPLNSSLQIFNRWGNKVHESKNYNNTWTGNELPDGTYYYIIILPNKETYHGFVEIRR